MTPSSSSPPSRSPASPRSIATARERFLHVDRYRVEREWKRYEGTAQRDLFRELRERFLARHVRTGAWALDLGSGPGRFTPYLRGTSGRVVALDLSQAALRYMSERGHRAGRDLPLPDRVRGDALRPPFRTEQFGTVAVLGNTLGFAGAEGPSLLRTAESLVAPGGALLVEVAPGPGERSRYLARLPKRSVARLLRSPTQAVIPRIFREGFSTEPARKAKPGPFLRVGATELATDLEHRGWRVGEVLAVAPALGPDPDRLEAVRGDPKAWDHLLGIEEELGREPERWTAAAAVLVAAAAQPSMRAIK